MQETELTEEQQIDQRFDVLREKIMKIEDSAVHTMMRSNYLMMRLAPRDNTFWHELSKIEGMVDTVLKGQGDE